MWSVAQCNRLFATMQIRAMPSTHLCAGVAAAPASSQHTAFKLRLSVVQVGSHPHKLGVSCHCPAPHWHAGWATDLQDTCSGDSGGPLVRETSSGPDMLVGITSYGPDGCGSEYNLGAYTSVPRMRTWIDAQIRALKV